MTVKVNKSEIHLGWETAAAIVMFLVVTMFGAGTVTTKFLNKQDEIYSIVKALSKSDSVIRQNEVKTADALRRHDSSLDSIKKLLVVKYANAPGMKFYTERKTSRGLELKEVNPNQAN